MKKIKRQLASLPALAFMVVFFDVAQAAPAPIVTSTQGSAERDDNAFGIGFTSSIAQRPFIGVDDQVTSLLYLSYKYKRFYIEGLDVGLNVLKSDNYKLDILGTPRFYEVEAAFADNGELNGIDMTNPSYFGGLSLQAVTDFAVYTFQLLHDLVESDGNEAVVTASKSFRVIDTLTLIPSIGVSYQDGDLVDYYFGVQANEVQPGRPLYQGQASLNVNATLNAIYQATRHIELLGQIKYEVLGSGITDSPIVDEDSIASLTVGMVYRF